MDIKKYLLSWIITKNTYKNYPPKFKSFYSTVLVGAPGTMKGFEKLALEEKYSLKNISILILFLVTAKFKCQIKSTIKFEKGINMFIVLFHLSSHF